MGTCACSCSGQIRLIYTCSGASDVGELSDRIGRRLRDQGVGAMTCLAAMGAEISGYVQSAKGASEIIAIDGCPVGCVRRIMEKHGVTATHFILTEIGLEKGKTAVDQKTIEDYAQKIGCKIKGCC